MSMVDPPGLWKIDRVAELRVAVASPTGRRLRSRVLGRLRWLAPRKRHHSGQEEQMSLPHGTNIYHDPSRGGGAPSYVLCLFGLSEVANGIRLQRLAVVAFLVISGFRVAQQYE